MGHMRNWWRALVGGLVAVAALAGCAAVEISPPISSCARYEAPSNFGKFTVQQSAKGKSIQWGAYPNQTYSGTWYEVTVRLDGRKIDSKSHNYAPHGSVGADRAKKNSGKILQLAGTVTRKDDVVLVFDMRCRVL